MPTTRKKVIKTVYKHEESDDEFKDFSDSGSEAQISEPPSSDDEEVEADVSSAEEFSSKSRKNLPKPPIKRKPKFAKEFVAKITKQNISAETEDNELPNSQFSVKDLSDADKLLPSVLNLSESDSSDDEAPNTSKKKTAFSYPIPEEDESADEIKEEYTDVWSNTIHGNSAEIAKQTFKELEQHKTKMEQTKASLQSYVPRSSIEQGTESNVTDLLALGEEAPQKSPAKKQRKTRKNKADSDSELDDWEEVKEAKNIPAQGIQLVVALPDYVSRKTKKVDVEMMMKRKMNRVKKEHQVFMHKVHVLCWIGHGNYISPVLNDQEIMAAVLAMVPKGCYPEGRLTMKYVEQITSWFKDKFTVKIDKNENKYRPKAPPLKNILLDLIKKRVVTSNKYFVFVFVAMLRALGLQCRIMFNFVTVPLRPPSSELCSLSTKPKEEEKSSENDKKEKQKAARPKPKKTDSKNKPKSKEIVAQVDGTYDNSSSDSEFENLMQVDGNDDGPVTQSRTSRTRSKKAVAAKSNTAEEDEGVSPPKRSRTKPDSRTKTIQKAITEQKLDALKKPKIKNTDKSKGDAQSKIKTNQSESIETAETVKSPLSLSLKKVANNNVSSENTEDKHQKNSLSPRKTRSNNKPKSQNNQSTSHKSNDKINSVTQSKRKLTKPKITVTNENQETFQSKYFEDKETCKDSRRRSTRKRSNTTVNENMEKNIKESLPVTRTRSAPGSAVEKSKYFGSSENVSKKPKLSTLQQKKQEKLEDVQRVSHKDLIKPKAKPKNDVTNDLVTIIKGRIKGAKEEAKKGIVKGKVKEESDDDSDHLSVEDPKRHSSGSDEDFKPAKISPRAPKRSSGSTPSTSKKRIDRRVLSSDDELTNSKKIDVWCEIFVEELEQWIAVDIVNGKVHCTSAMYSHATHPVCYVIGWDNANYLKDLTRRYVPHWNTVTRKQRAELEWWKAAVKPWLGPRNARDKEEDDALDRMQLEAPLPKSIAEYKNHPLYALKRHLLKFEALYPEDAAVLGFVRKEPVYARECVYTCRSRDVWLKEAKVVRMGEKPYKIVTARPKWDRLSNKLIKDKPLEVFGPWQVQDYEPPTAENGVVPRNAYGNVELFKECMLPKGTVHIKLPGLNKVARKLNIDCAPAMTGFDYSGGYAHPAYDGFVVCNEFEEIITEAWVKDQEEQLRKEREKVELRVYGNWKRLIKGLLIRERLKHKYGFEKPSTSQTSKGKKGPRFVAKKNS